MLLPEIRSFIFMILFVILGRRGRPSQEFLSIRSQLFQEGKSILLGVLPIHMLDHFLIIPFMSTISVQNSGLKKQICLLSRSLLMVNGDHIVLCLSMAKSISVRVCEISTKENLYTLFSVNIIRILKLGQKIFPMFHLHRIVCAL